MNTVKNKNVLTGIACLGMIEERYAEISNLLVENLINKQWIATQNLAHYSIHKELDIHHSDLFFKLLDPEWNNAKSRENIILGINLGNSLIINIYNELLE